MDERPGLYIRLEVGVTWPRHQNKRRSISYTSGAIKDRQQQLLPAVAPALDVRTWPHVNNDHQIDPDHAYLQHIYNHASHSNYVSEQPYWQLHHDAPATTGEAISQSILPPFDQSTSRSHYVAYHPSYRPQMPQSSCNNYLPRRSRSMSSHNSRGSSGPSGTHERPWDAEPEPLGSTALPVRDRSSRSRSQVLKPLPATPSQFRLGEDSMPWSASPDPADYSAVELSRRGRAEISSSLAGGRPISSPQGNVDDRERGQTVEMQSLATALMTVDNGFEDQWWFQGPRMATMAGDLIPPAPLRDIYDHVSESREYASPFSAHRFQASTPSSTIVDLVSPLSGFSSPVSRQSQLET